MADNRIIKASLKDPSAFSILYDQYAPLVASYLIRRAGVQAAEDLLAETFTVAFEKRTTYKTNKYPEAKGWLFGIAHNVLRRYLRDLQRQQKAHHKLGNVIQLTTKDEHARVENQLAARQQLSAVDAAMNHLKPADRTTLELYAYGDLTYQQVSEALGIPVGTVQSRLNRARRILDTQLNTQHSQEA